MMTQIMIMSATVIMFKYIVEEDKMWTQDYYKAQIKFQATVMVSLALSSFGTVDLVSLL